MVDEALNPAILITGGEGGIHACDCLHGRMVPEKRPNGKIDPSRGPRGAAGGRVAVYRLMREDNLWKFVVTTDPPYNVRVEHRSNKPIAAGMSSLVGLHHHHSFDVHRGASKAMGPASPYETVVWAMQSDKSSMLENLLGLIIDPVFSKS
jgi:hypothetical protein